MRSLLLAATLVSVARGLSVAPPRVHACSCGAVVLNVNSPILGVCHCHCAGCRTRQLEVASAREDDAAPHHVISDNSVQRARSRRTEERSVFRGW